LPFWLRRRSTACHDDGEKTILGRTGRFGPDDLVQILASHPATSRRLAGRRSYLRLRPFSVFADPGTKPFADQPKNPSVADTVLQELDQPIVVDRVKEAFSGSTTPPCRRTARL
jgi:hypothetical protein